MSDIHSFIRRGNNNSEAINKLQALITPLAFAEPEADSLKERIILSNLVRKRTLTSLTGLDITTSNSESRDRISSSITILPDTSTPTTFPVTPTLTGILTFPNKISGAGALFTGKQYISIPDDDQLDLDITNFTIAFWFKSDGVSQGNQTVYSKAEFSTDRDYCSICADFNTSDYSTIEDVDLVPGLEVQLVANTTADHCSDCTDFDGSFSTSTASEAVRIIISDGTNLLDQTVDTENLFDGSWHSIVIISTDSVSDYCSTCTDFDTGDYSVISTPLITIYMDKVSKGNIDHSSITSSLNNTKNAILGASDITLENPLKGNLALFEYQGTNWNTTNISDYHDKYRITVTNQKLAFYFVGNDSTVDTLDKVY